ncbi:MAG: HAD family phosphatase [Syntrophobacteraceae bacterium]|nr:HAD family phosphatase [Syntrophobacteraceae bacterium]
MAQSLLQAVIFDCDGILVDTEPLHYAAFQEVLQPLALGFDYAHYMRHYIGLDDRDAFREAFREGGKALSGTQLLEFMRAKEEALQRIIARGTPTFPGVVELVRELAGAGIPMAVASGALRHEVETFVRGLRLEDAFPVIVAADDVECSKPDPETYLKAVSRVGEHFGLGDLRARGCVAIEDTPTGMRSARQAGLYVVGVAHSYSMEELRDEADHVVRGLPELSLAVLSRLMDGP